MRIFWIVIQNVREFVGTLVFHRNVFKKSLLKGNNKHDSSQKWESKTSR